MVGASYCFSVTLSQQSHGASYLVKQLHQSCNSNRGFKFSFNYTPYSNFFRPCFDALQMSSPSTSSTSSSKFLRIHASSQGNSSKTSQGSQRGSKEEKRHADPTLRVPQEAIPFLTYGADGKLFLDANPIRETRSVPSPNELKAEMRTGYTKGRVGGGVDKSKVPTSAPKYSKAARRFYNANLRKEERLAKVLATAGIASRRACEEIVFSGRVTVNGEICKLPQTTVDLKRDNIYVDGRSLSKKAPPKLCFVVNKPKGYICSTVAQGATKPAIDIVGEYMENWMKKNPGVPKPRLFTVGRLDVNTTGLLIITNDGDLAQRASHPSFGLTREYVATVDSRVTRRQFMALLEGVEVDGVKVKPVSVEIVTQESGDDSNRVRIVVSEGRNHEVRKMVANAGMALKSLKRVRLGGLRMSRNLGVGKFEILPIAQLENILFKQAS